MSGNFTPQIVGDLTWIRCPRCAWPMVEGLCGQCGFEDYDYDPEDDLPDALVAIKPDVSGFEAQS